MDTRDDDIEFDFFDDEPATGETQSVSRPRLTRSPRRPVEAPSGPPHGYAPLLRLLGLVVIVVVLVLVFALLIESCGSSKHSSYANYMADVSKIAVQSTANGTAVATVLTTPGLKLTDIETKLRGIATEE